MVFDPSPRSEWKMISQGAEARVWKLPMASSDDTIPNDDDDDDNDTNSNNNNNTNDDQEHTHGFIVCKERFSKAYRHPELDAKLTKSRCRSEAKILEKCTTKSKIRVPKVIRISPPDLYLEYLTGPSVKKYLQEERQQDHQKQQKKEENGEDVVVVVVATTTMTKSNILDLAQQIGQLVGRLHNIGIVHGDLTTSNMMVLEVNDDSNSNKSETNNDDNKKDEGSSSSLLSSSLFEVALIDFGLSKSTFSVEEQAVDLYVLERALLSTHPELPENFFDHILEKYASTTMSAAADDGNNNDNSKKRKNLSQTTLQRLEQVRMRGRKRECFG
jgi:TP53 regulating kinase-like protein